MDTLSKWLLLMGSALAIVVGIAMYSLIAATQGARQPLVPVVVARYDIPERTLFTAANVDDLLQISHLPAEIVPRRALAEPLAVIGKATTTSLQAGEILLNSPDRIAASEGPSARPAATIPRDKVALAINATESVNVAGTLQAGDRVDVIATWNVPDGASITQHLFQDIRVFAAGRWQTDARAPQQAGTVTLLLDHQEALILEYLLQTGGHISLALRRFDQGGDIITEPITTETLLRRLNVAPPTALQR